MLNIKLPKKHRWEIYWVIGWLSFWLVVFGFMLYYGMPAK